MSIKSQLLQLFQTFKELSVKELVEKTAASKQMVHIILNQLQDEKIIEKLGRAPKTIYRLIKKQNFSAEIIKSEEISEEEKIFLQKKILVVTDTGNLLDGIEAFEQWCRQRKLPIHKTLQEFIATKRKYQAYYNKEGIIDGMEKLKNTKGYEHIWLDAIFYLDFYAIERFGKTYLGALLHYAKQGQNKFLMSILLKEISEKIKLFIQNQNADAIGYVPPTIKREIQLMKFLQSNLRINLPIIELKKLSGIIPVPQKSLSKLEERIKNAENTFAVTDQRNFKHIVLIDDAVGSGSTLNQIAEKIKKKQLAEKVTGLAIVGSLKGFDVITDV